MHAASVHPEPGSNSLKYCISTGFTQMLSHFRVICLLNYLFRALCNKFKRIFGVFVLCLLSLYTWLLFNFQWAFLWLLSFPAVRHQLIYYITSAVVCQGVLQNFFEVFSWPFGSTPCLSDSLYIIPHHPTFVNTFSKVFSRNCKFFCEYRCGCRMERSRPFPTRVKKD